jgi:hypothetical protein
VSGLLAQPFVQAQRLAIHVNGVLVAHLAIAGRHTWMMPIPAAVVEPSRPLLIAFHHPCRLAPADHGISPGPQALSIAFSRPRLVLDYAGGAIG